MKIVIIRTLKLTMLASLIILSCYFDAPEIVQVAIITAVILVRICFQAIIVELEIENGIETHE